MRGLLLSPGLLPFDTFKHLIIFTLNFYDFLSVCFEFDSVFRVSYSSDDLCFFATILCDLHIFSSLLTLSRARRPCVATPDGCDESQSLVVPLLWGTLVSSYYLHVLCRSVCVNILAWLGLDLA